MKKMYTSEFVDFLKERYQEAQTIRNLQNMTNAHFGTGFTYKQIRMVMYKNGLRGDKKFGVPSPLYAERKDSQGYVLVKVSMTGSRYKRWKEKHRLVWEQAHGKIPKGMSIIFLDNDRQNCALENLAMVSKAEVVRLSQFGLRSGNREVTLAGIAVAKHSTATHNRLEKMLGQKGHRRFNSYESTKRARERKKSCSSTNSIEEF